MADTGKSPPIGLGERDHFPEDLLDLLAAYPRDMWRAHSNMGALTRFWLSRHEQFRTVSAQLNESNSGFLEGDISVDLFQRTMVPGFQMLLGALGEHHTVEDHHYFPKFIEAAPELKRGFDILDNDHHQLHETMEALVDAANGFIRSSGRDELLTNGEVFVSANQKLLSFVHQHLEDEEDLIVPLLLDRGEERFH